MDSDGLPLVGPGIDYTKVEAINQKRTIAFINHFITHTSRFLNRFSCVCEEKLENLHGRIQQLEISLSLLEAKLSSIPGLENVTAPTSSSSATGASTPAASGEAATPAVTPTATPAALPAPVENGSEAQEEPAQEEAQAANPVCKDPRYVKFFKMVQFGVPPGAVKGKMVIEGLNPDFLDTPNAPAPPGGAPAPQSSPGDDSDDDESEEASSDSDASFSD
ncbi:WASH complex subunit 3-like [Littorina saxatilis]|uniref:WASH complex subunit 3 n=1 Tax=Littorina saxatilis TaxID=31220 RepID=A0AAN9GHL5_9CAEN